MTHQEQKATYPHLPSCPPIEKKALDRFIPMYNVAVNLCTKMNDNRFTFILLFDRRRDQDTTKIHVSSSDYLRLYAVRTFIDIDAKRVKDMLDYAYFEIIGHENTRKDDPKALRSPPKTYIEDYLLREWQTHCRPPQNSQDTDIHNTAKLVLPSIYCYIFDSATYTSDTFLSTYHNMPALPDLVEEREAFKTRINNYMKTADLGNEIAYMEKLTCRNGQQDDLDNDEVWAKKLLEEINQRTQEIDPSYEFETHFYINPRNNDNRTECALTLPRHDDESPSGHGVDYDKFINKLEQQCYRRDNAELACCCQPPFSDSALLHAWLDILHLCDCRLFTQTRLKRDFPCKTNALRLASAVRARESLFCTLALQHFCTRNKINDIIRHVCITQNPSLYQRENAYLRNFSSYCEWKNYLDANRAQALSARLSSEKILLEWLDNEISTQAFKKYAAIELPFELSLVPSHHCCAPPASYHHVNDFNFHYFFISCQPLFPCYPPLSNDFSAQYHAWFTVMQENLRTNERLHIADIPRHAAKKRRSRVSLADIIPPDIATNAVKRSKIMRSPTGNDQKTEPVSTTVEAKEHSIRERLLMHALKQQKNTNEPTMTARTVTQKWRFVVGQRVYAVSIPKNDSLDKNTKNTGAGPIEIADLDHLALENAAKIRIICYLQRQPRNTASVKHWLSCHDMEKKNDTTNTLHRLWLKIHDEKSNDSEDDNHSLMEQDNTQKSDDKGPPDILPGNPSTKAAGKNESLPTISQIMNDFQGDNTGSCRQNKTEINSEQQLFIELFLTCCDAKHTLLINGNPGTGKTTVMMHLVRHLCDRVVCLLPTKVLRERMVNTILSMKRKNPNLLEPLSQNASRLPKMTRVMTFSAFVRRLMQYKLSPQVYSRIIEHYLTDQQQRMCRTIRPAFLNGDFLTTYRPSGTIQYPHVAFIDEYNLIDWHQHFLIGEACEMLCVARVLYGDSGQSAPIRSKNDNAEMISLRCALTVQFLDNKRILHSQGTLRELLNDHIWNWRSNNENTNVCNYVRSLLYRHLGDRINPHVQLVNLDAWFSAVSRLLDWYDNKPCRRHLRTIHDMCTLLNLIPTLPLPCIIALKNRTCDRSNYWIAKAICDYIVDRCQDALDEASHGQQLSRFRSKHLVDNYCIVVRRNAYASQSVYEANAEIIETKGESSEYMHGLIADDPWCADLTLILGAVYRFIGNSKLVERDTLLQLIAFLPESDDVQISPNRCSAPPCDTCYNPSYRFVKKRNKAQCPHTQGCGVPTFFRDVKDSHHRYSPTEKLKRYALTHLPRLLMRRVYGETISTQRRYLDHSEEAANSLHCDPTSDDNTAFPSLIVNKNNENESVFIVRSSSDLKDVLIISRAYYTLTRCSSVWTPPLHTMTGNPREGMRLYGYPLILNAAVTSYRVQGETIADTDVYIDFERMGKEQALVALSRVRRFEQIRGVINIDKFGR